jgi:hypothetical protein
VERGWKNKEVYLCNHEGIKMMNKGFLLDPLFWIALGKTEGWILEGHAGRKQWREQQHRFIDAIQQGRSIDEFFGEILKK